MVEVLGSGELKMLHYVVVVSVRPAENHEAGFTEREAAELYAQDVLWVYLQHLEKDRRHDRRQKELFTASVRRQLSTRGGLVLSPDWAEAIGLQQIHFSQESLYPLGSQHQYAERALGDRTR